MQTRLFASLAGALLGAAVSSTVNSSVDLSPTLVLIGCTVTGLALGYVVSMLFDVFAMPSGGQN
jgi:hypothetical protein